jgi:hypothetical protein
MAISVTTEVLQQLIIRLLDVIRKSGGARMELRGDPDAGNQAHITRMAHLLELKGVCSGSG